MFIFIISRAVHVNTCNSVFGLLELLFFYMQCFVCYAMFLLQHSVTFLSLASNLYCLDFFFLVLMLILSAVWDTQSLRKERQHTGRGERGRHHLPQNNYQNFHHQARPDMPVDMIPFEELRHEPPPKIYAPSANDHGIPSPMNIPIPSPSSQSPRDPLNVRTHSPSSQVRRNNFHGNGFMLPQDSKLEFGTLGALPLEVTSREHASRSGSASNNQVSGPVSPISVAKKTGMGSNGMR